MNPERGRWTIQAPLGGNKNGQRYWQCLCKCGTVKAVREDHLLSGESQSCGCLSKETTARLNTRHGGCKRGGVTPEYQTWHGMLRRCYDHRRREYPRYGGRGIVVCDTWRASFPSFLRDMGPRPSPGHSLDRINNDGNYEPANCRWATRAEQMRNTSLTKLTPEIAGEIRALVASGLSKAEVSRRLGVSYSSVKQVAYGNQWARPIPLWEAA